MAYSTDTSWSFWKEKISWISSDRLEMLIEWMIRGYASPNVVSTSSSESCVFCKTSSIDISNFTFPGDRVEWLKSTAYRKMLLLFWELCEEHAAKKQQQIPKKILQITVEVKRILRFSIFIIPPLPFTSDIPQFCKHVLLSFYYN